jgi:hypothetical protein
MGAAVNATKVFTGTPSYTTGVFYNMIKTNKRKAAEDKRAKVNNFEVDWKEVGRSNPDYKKFVQNELLRLGEDSDEFRLSYKIQWILDKGMFSTSEKLEELGDNSMSSVVHSYHRTPVVAGIDCGRKQDSTIVTVVFIDWDNPDQLGYYHHHVLNWLDLEGMDWEEQYFRIVEFLSNYNIWKVGIDIGGLGDTVAQRLRLLMPNIEIVELGSAQSEQTVRWKHLKVLMDRKQISWPNGANVKRTRNWKRFRQQMEDLLLIYKGPYVLAEAPGAANAHDDYPDSLSMACVLSLLNEDGDAGEVEVYDNFIYRGRNIRR